MKSGSTKSDETEGIGLAEASGALPMGPIEAAKEAKEKRASWIKNIGTGMRTLRLRKQGRDKGSSILEPELRTRSTTPPPPPVPTSPLPPPSPVPSSVSEKQKQALPALPSDPQPSPSPSKSLQQHVSKGKKGRSGGSVNGTIPRDKSKSNPIPAPGETPGK
jgi:hypothetical protein